MLPQIVLLPPLGHKEAIGTLGYPIVSKLEDKVAFVHVSVDRQTHTRLYNIDEGHGKYASLWNVPST